MRRPAKKMGIKLNKEQLDNVRNKVDELLELCQMYHIPMFATVVTENNEKTTEYIRAVYGSDSHDIVLKDDQINGHILIANGFHAVPPREDATIDMEDFFPAG